LEINEFVGSSRGGSQMSKYQGACRKIVRAANTGLFIPLHVFAGALLLLLPTTALASTVSVGSVSFNADFPLTGEQSIVITNLTGLVDGCNAVYSACSNLALTGWTLTVDYTSTFYNQSGNPSLAVPYVVQWNSSADDIQAGASLTVPLDLCNGDAVGICATPTTTVTSLFFSGAITPAGFPLYDPNANGGSGGPGATFVSGGSFLVTVSPTSDFPNDYYEAVDIIVSEQSSAIPEPACAWLVAVAATFFACQRRRGA
jgi:hypothetical protein